MSKVLLTNCPAVDMGYSPFFMTEKLAPIGQAHLAGALTEAGHEVDFVDMYHTPIDLKTYVERTKPDFLGISISTILYQKALSLIDSVSELDIPIIVGGPHPSIMPQTIPERVDYIVVGEGEKSIVDIVDGKVDNRIVSYPLVQDINTLPTPKFDIFDKYQYHNNTPFLTGKKMTSLCTSRGCPFQCTFCSNVWYGKKYYRYLTAENTFKQVKYHYDRGVDSVYFREDNFTLNRERVENFCEMVKPLNIQWVCESRIHNLEEDYLIKMRDAGLKGLYLGLESGNPRVLEFMKKGITVEMIREKVKLIHSLGIKIMGSFVLGIPTETDEEIMDTFRLIDELKCEISNRNVFCGIPGSELYDYMLKNKCYSKIDSNFLIYPEKYEMLAKACYGFVPQVR